MNLPAGAGSTPIKERYVAGKTFRTLGDWSPGWVSVNDLLATSGQTIRNRVRELVRNFPPFKRAVNVLVDYTVGDSVEYQPRVKRLNGALNQELNQKITDAWLFWADEADVSKKLHLFDLMRLAKRQEVEAGEFVIVRQARRDPGRFLQLALQVYEADWLTDQNVKPGSANAIVEMGVEYEPSTGAAVAYHFADPDSWGKAIRIPADRIVHGFDTLRPGQLRGVSDLVTAVMLAHDLSDYMDAEIDAAKLASRYLAFVTSQDPMSFQTNRAVDTETGASVEKIEEIESAMIEYLRPGEGVVFAKHERGGTAFEAFVKLILRLISISTGIPYEILAQDYGDLNYTSLRGARNDMQKHFLPLQGRFVRQFCEPMKKWFLNAAVLENRLILPRYFSDPWFYQTAYWQPPGLEAIDPLREGKADIDRVENLLMSPQEIASRRGRNYTEILDELQEAKRLQIERGLMKQSTNTALKSNPAAVADQ